MTASPLPFRVTRPLFQAEDDVLAMVDVLTILEGVFSNAGKLTSAEYRAVGRLVGQAVDAARKVEMAWTSEFGGAK